MLSWEIHHLRDQDDDPWVLHQAFVESPLDDGPLDLRIQVDDDPDVHWEIIRYDVGDIERGTVDTVDAAKAVIAEVLPRVLAEIAEERASER